MSDIVSVVSAVGFPIVAAIGCAAFVKFIYSENQKQLTEINKEHKEEVSKMTEALHNNTNEMKEALNNNTLVLQKLIDRLEK